MSNSTLATVQDTASPSNYRYNSTLSIARPPCRLCSEAHYLPMEISEGPIFAAVAQKPQRHALSYNERIQFTRFLILSISLVLMIL